MRHNESLEELAALQSLGALEGDDASVFETHLAEGCARCEELLVDFRNASAAVASGTPSLVPRSVLRSRILASLEGPRAAAASVREEPRSSAAAAWLLAAAAAVVLVFVGLDDARLRREREELASRASLLAARVSEAERDLARRDLRTRVLESDDVRILFLSGKDPQPQARAKVFWSERAKRGVLVAGNLQPLPPDKQYELWVFDKGKPVPAGVFDADREGRALIESPDLSAIAAAQNFAVTVEPRGGVPAPTGPIVLVGNPAA